MNYTIFYLASAVADGVKRRITYARRLDRASERPNNTCIPAQSLGLARARPSLRAGHRDRQSDAPAAGAGRHGGVLGRHPGGGDCPRPAPRQDTKNVAAPTIAVVSGGFTGIELALELRDRFLAHGVDGRPNGCASC